MKEAGPGQLNSSTLRVWLGSTVVGHSCGLKTHITAFTHRCELSFSTAEFTVAAGLSEQPTDSSKKKKKTHLEVVFAMGTILDFSVLFAEER